jgi:hypothetical protein
MTSPSPRPHRSIARATPRHMSERASSSRTAGSWMPSEHRQGLGRPSQPCRVPDLGEGRMPRIASDPAPPREGEHPLQRDQLHRCAVLPVIGRPARLHGGWVLAPCRLLEHVEPAGIDGSGEDSAQLLDAQNVVAGSGATLAARSALRDLEAVGSLLAPNRFPTSSGNTGRNRSREASLHRGGERR